MAFAPEELRVLRRALALALHPAPASAQDVRACLRLAESLDEAMREGARLRAFLVADVARYRAALPGTVVGYLTVLEEALGAGYRARPDDLAALRALRGNGRAAALLDRCQALAERDVRARLARTAPRPAPEAAPAIPAAPAASALPAAGAATVPASRTRLLALRGGLSDAAQGPAAPAGASASGCAAPAGPRADESGQDKDRNKDDRDRNKDDRDRDKGKDRDKDPVGKPEEQPGRRPAPAKPDQAPAAPRPARRPVPTPGEVFPRRKPAAPPADPPQRLAAV
ncbi:hypothetical protein ACFOOM_16910 [Streptomyces echinoruber]|uniref:Uncharacterized protein n=1 Tax=Streptomyces echinoruber TaxID=68898 RepID=A0A918VB13_9ACTN|nr:hypothetical protein [Streptomyces echinoruber]GGZ85241.1 hypothetical protein GCM10010389_24320 [Streptomyces echinoruber]